MKSRKNLRLNLGCGYDHKKGFINIDVDRRVKPDRIHDLSQPLPFKDATVKEIYLQDVLEHFTKEDGVILLQECQRVLQQRGKITIRVPNVSAIFQKYRNQEDLLFHFLYGNTSQSGVWGAHKYGYSKTTFDELLDQMQLYLIEHRVEDTNNVFVCKKGIVKKTDLRVGMKLTEMLFLTPLWLHQKKKVSWILTTLPHPFIGKLLLRPLSRWVFRIVVKDQKGASYCQTILRYSHLKTQIIT